MIELEPDKYYFEDIEFENMELVYNYCNLKKQTEYYNLFAAILDFVFEKISFNVFQYYNLKPLNIDFINWFFKHSKELKRLLKFEELLLLNQKFELSKIKNIEVKNFKDLSKIWN